VAHYAVLVEANYADALAGVEQLQEAIQDFTADPSESSLEEAREAWLSARDPYGQTEAFRFYEGPIDNEEDGPEGLINAWPIDESYIDYVVDGDGEVLTTGIINRPDDYPDIDRDLLAELNEGESETSISTGYHAVEFLLWGQDLSDSGPGERPHTDYLTSADATAENQERRAMYLEAATELLLENLSSVHDQWREESDNYRAEFLALPVQDALGKMLLGMGSLAGAELSGERMIVAFDNKDQEDEHSCFSDNTLADLLANASAVQNVLLGRYAELDGPGIDDLVEAKDPALAQELRDLIQEAIDEIDAIPAPFDQAILGDEDSEAGKHVLAAHQALQTFTERLGEAASVLDIALQLEE
jgi:putative iron-regulated protein